MLLKKVGIYNDIPKEMLPPIPDGNPAVVFEFQNFYIDPQSGSRRWPEYDTIKPKSEFVNPETNEVIPIALIKSSDKEGNNIACHKVVVSPQSYGGTFVLQLGTAENNDIYRFMLLSSQNGSNPNRVANEPILYAVQDLKAKAVENSTERKKRREAIIFIDGMKDADLQQIALVLDLSTSSDVEVLRDAIEEYAEKQPVKFLEAVKSKDKDIIEVVKKAIKLGVMYRDGSSLKWEGAGEVVPLTAPNDSVVVEEAVHYIKTRAHGDAIVNMAREKVLQKEKGKATPPKAGRPASKDKE